MSLNYTWKFNNTYGTKILISVKYKGNDNKVLESNKNNKNNQKSYNIFSYHVKINYLFYKSNLSYNKLFGDNNNKLFVYNNFTNFNIPKNNKLTEIFNINNNMKLYTDKTCSYITKDNLITENKNDSTMYILKMTKPSGDHNCQSRNQQSNIAHIESKDYYGYGTFQFRVRFNHKPDNSNLLNSNEKNNNSLGFISMVSFIDNDIDNEKKIHNEIAIGFDENDPTLIHTAYWGTNDNLTDNERFKKIYTGVNLSEKSYWYKVEWTKNILIFYFSKDDYDDNSKIKYNYIRYVKSDNKNNKFIPDKVMSFRGIIRPHDENTEKITIETERNLNLLNFIYKKCE